MSKEKRISSVAQEVLSNSPVFDALVEMGWLDQSTDAATVVVIKNKLNHLEDAIKLIGEDNLIDLGKLVAADRVQHFLGRFNPNAIIEVSAYLKNPKIQKQEALSELKKSVELLTSSGDVGVLSSCDLLEALALAIEMSTLPNGLKWADVVSATSYLVGHNHSMRSGESIGWHRDERKSRWYSTFTASFDTVISGLKHFPNLNVFGLSRLLLLPAETIKILQNNENLRCLYLESSEYASWNQKIINLHKLISNLGFSTADREVVDEALIAEFLDKRQKLGEDRATLFTNIQTLKPEQKYRLVAALRNNKGHSELRRLQNDLSLISPTLEGDKYHEWLNRAALYESPHHPFVTSGLAVTVGVENEYCYLPGTNELPFAKNLAILAEQMGIHQGAGDATGTGDNSTSRFCELSPGPFYDYNTCLTIMDLYYNSGIIDVYKNASFGIHFNLGLKSNIGLEALMWGLYLAGLGYDPRTNKNVKEFYGVNTKSFRLVPHSPTRIECKDFSVTTPQELEWLLYYGSRVAIALKQVHKAYQVSDLDSFGRIKSTMPVGPVSHLELVNIYKNFYNDIEILLRLLNISSSPMTQFVKDDINRLDQIITAQYPELLNRHNGVSTAENNPVTMRNVRYSNPLLAARAILDSTVSKIENYLDRYENAARLALLEISQMADGQARWAKIRDYFERYQPGVFKNMPLNWQIEQINRVSSLYGLPMLEFKQL